MTEHLASKVGFRKLIIASRSLRNDWLPPAQAVPGQPSDGSPYLPNASASQYNVSAVLTGSAEMALRALIKTQLSDSERVKKPEKAE